MWQVENNDQTSNTNFKWVTLFMNGPKQNYFEIDKV